METQGSHIELYDEPRSIMADRVLREPVTALLVAGIVNPLGPTLSAVVVLGEPKTGAKLPLVEMMLNPFNQELQTVGEIAVGQKWRPSEVIRSLFDLPLLKGCPSLLLPSIYLDEDDSLTLHAEFLRVFADSRGVMERVRQSLGNPWGRVSEEMSSARRQLSTSLLNLKRRQSREQDAGRPEGETNPLGEDEARELATLLLSEKHMGPEIQAFFYAWNGSIKQVPGLAATAMSFETFADLFEHIVRTCRLPDLPERSKVAQFKAAERVRWSVTDTDLAHQLAKHPKAVEALLKEPSRWIDLTDEELYYFVFGSLGLYGVTNDESRIPALQALYDLYQTRIDVGGRLELLESIDDFVSSGKCSATAFFPSLFRDETEVVVATATIKYASCAPQEDGDPLTGPKMLLEFFASGRAKNRQGIFAGLTLLGDRRVYELLKAHRDDLTDDELSDIAATFNGFAYVAAIDFYLDWLEQTDDERAPARFAHLCAALARIGRDAVAPFGQEEPVVVDLERSFPADDREEPIRFVKQYPLRAYATIIAPRLMALAKAERGERLIPSVMDFWGLKT